VRAGAPFTVIIGGEAGIGKTRLIREFEAGLPSDVRLLAGQCVDLGSVAAPYAPVKTALRTLVAEVGAERVLDRRRSGRRRSSRSCPSSSAPGTEDAAAAASNAQAAAGPRRATARGDRGAPRDVSPASGPSSSSSRTSTGSTRRASRCSASS
jgi:hypothetical protein